jgi:MoaA/NifB/PqqE/SkfB family radical SAM enzyme
MHLAGLHLLLSYQCTYRCDHCFVHSSPEAPGTMTLAQVRDAIEQAAGLGSIAEIYLEGGEPFLFYPLMLETVRLAKNAGLDVGIVTNGYYATTVEDAKLWLKPLKELGVNSISFSDDTFHSGDERESCAARARQAAEELGIECGTICIEPPIKLVDEHHPGEPITGGGVRFRGRAADKLADDELPRQAWTCFRECPDEDWNDISRLHLDAYGNLYPCQGVVVGNLNRQSLREVVDSYSPETHPIIGPLMRGGPAELVSTYNLPLKGAFLDACHLCYLARQELRRRFAQELTPAQVYGSRQEE